MAEKWLISQLLLFSRLKTDGESTIVTRRVGKNNVGNKRLSSRVIGAIAFGSC